MVFYSESVFVEFIKIFWKEDKGLVRCFVKRARESDSDLIDGMAAKPISNSGRW